MNDDNLVAGRVDVELEGVGVPLERSTKGGQGIFRVFAFGAPVGNAFQGPCSLYGDVYLSPRADIAPPRRQAVIHQAFDLNGPDLVTSTCWTE